MRFKFSLAIIFLWGFFAHAQIENSDQATLQKAVNNYQNWQKKSDTEKAQLKTDYDRFQKMPSDKQKILEKRNTAYQALPPERRQWVNKRASETKRARQNSNIKKKAHERHEKREEHRERVESVRERTRNSHPKKRNITPPLTTAPRI